MYDIYIAIVTAPLVWLGLGLLAVLLMLMHVKPPSGDRLRGQAPRLAEKPGLNALAWFAVLLVPVWLALLVAVLGSLWSLWLSPPAEDEALAYRFHYLAIVGLMTALAGLVGTPLALIRVFTNERQTKATEEGLTTERISKAVEGLGAEKEVNRLGRNVRYDLGEDRVATFEWQDAQTPIPDEASGQEFGDWTNVAVTQPNLEVRIGAIYALERISQDSPRDHVQIMEILCAYIRQNAPGDAAEDFPEPEWQPLAADADQNARKAHLAARKERFGIFPFQAIARIWARGLKPRTDIQVAAQVIGRRTNAQVAAERDDKRHGDQGYRLDLRGANLQGVNLSRLDLREALLTGARLEGADLGWARLEGANLRGARMEGANFREARLEGAGLGRGRLEGAYLREARLEGADLREARLDGADLGAARMHGAALRKARLEGAYLVEARLEGADLLWARLEAADLSAASIDARTNFKAAVVQYAGLQSSDLSNSNLRQDQVNDMFGDGSVRLPDGVARPGHWPEEELELLEFHTQWRAWQTVHGFAPKADG